jgi:hypothetical protein
MRNSSRQLLQIGEKYGYTMQRFFDLIQRTGEEMGIMSLEVRPCLSRQHAPARWQLREIVCAARAFPGLQVPGCRPILGVRVAANFTILPPAPLGRRLSSQDERLDELVPRVVIDKFAKAYIEGYMTLLQQQLLYPPLSRVDDNQR